VFLTAPASYLSLSDLEADTTLDLTDRTGTAISGSILNGMLEEASGHVDAYIGQSFLPRQITKRFIGSGTNFLFLNERFVIYVRQLKIVLPNAVGFDAPVSALLVDSEFGTLQNMTPLVFQTYGITTMFPKGVPVDVTFAHGLGMKISAPQFTLAIANTQNPLPPGSYDVAITSMTPSGESIPSAVQTISLPSGGGVSASITNSPGAMRYYVYAAPHGTTPLTWRCESQGYIIGNSLVGGTFDNTPSTDVMAYNLDGSAKTPPTTDTSMWPLQGKYAALKKATRLLVQQQVWELKNLSNQGVYMQMSGPKKIMWKDNLKSIFAKQLDDLLESLTYQGIS
jgi:hypothetical protein